MRLLMSLVPSALLLALAKMSVSVAVAAPATAELPTPALEHRLIRLPHKPTAPLAYGFGRGRGAPAETHLVVFLNGLLGAQAVWNEAVEALLARWDASRAYRPSLVTYDRYGQGGSARDPYDETHELGHDLREVVQDLEIFVSEVWKAKHDDGDGGNDDDDDYDDDGAAPPPPPPLPRLIFVANSIGAVVGRYFAQTRPGTTAGLLLLDSNMANSDQVSLFPDPDAPGFDPGTLPPGVTPADLRAARTAYNETFGPAVRNPENFDRRNVAALLPDADQPALAGNPRIVVVGHDPDKFARDGADGSLQCPVALTNAYVNPAWARYNEGLVRLTSAERGEGPIIAADCGHFIQKDDPDLVARLAQDLVAKVISDV